MDQALDDIIKENNRDNRDNRPFRGHGGNRGRGNYRGRGRGRGNFNNFNERRNFNSQRQPRDGNRPFRQFRSFGNIQQRGNGRFGQHRYNQEGQNRRDFGFTHGLKVRFIGWHCLRLYIYYYNCREMKDDSKEISAEETIFKEDLTITIIRAITNIAITDPTITITMIMRLDQ